MGRTSMRWVHFLCQFLLTGIPDVSVALFGAPSSTTPGFIVFGTSYFSQFLKKNLGLPKGLTPDVRRMTKACSAWLLKNHTDFKETHSAFAEQWSLAAKLSRNKRTKASVFCFLPEVWETFSPYLEPSGKLPVLGQKRSLLTPGEASESTSEDVQTAKYSRNLHGQASNIHVLIPGMMHAFSEALTQVGPVVLATDYFISAAQLASPSSNTSQSSTGGGKSMDTTIPTAVLAKMRRTHAAIGNVLAAFESNEEGEDDDARVETLLMHPRKEEMDSDDDADDEDDEDDEDDDDEDDDEEEEEEEDEEEDDDDEEEEDDDDEEEEVEEKEKEEDVVEDVRFFFKVDELPGRITRRKRRSQREKPPMMEDKVTEELMKFITTVVDDACATTNEEWSKETADETAEGSRAGSLRTRAKVKPTPTSIETAIEALQVSVKKWGSELGGALGGASSVSSSTGSSSSRASAAAEYGRDLSGQETLDVLLKCLAISGKLSNMDVETVLVRVGEGEKKDIHLRVDNTSLPENRMRWADVEADDAGAEELHKERYGGGRVLCAIIWDGKLNVSGGYNHFHAYVFRVREEHIDVAVYDPLAPGRSVDKKLVGDFLVAWASKGKLRAWKLLRRLVADANGIPLRVKEWRTYGRTAFVQTDSWSCCAQVCICLFATLGDLNDELKCALHGKPQVLSRDLLAGFVRVCAEMKEWFATH